MNSVTLLLAWANEHPHIQVRFSHFKPHGEYEWLVVIFSANAPLTTGRSATTWDDAAADAIANLKKMGITVTLHG
jgi:hypothetical protein